MANPTGPDAQRLLGDVLSYVLSIEDQGKQRQVLEAIRSKLNEVVGGIQDERDRSVASQMIQHEWGVVRERSKSISTASPPQGNPQQSDGMGDTISFEHHLGQLVEQHPRFRRHVAEGMFLQGGSGGRPEVFKNIQESFARKNWPFFLIPAVVASVIFGFWLSRDSEANKGETKKETPKVEAPAEPSEDAHLNPYQKRIKRSLPSASETEENQENKGVVIEKASSAIRPRHRGEPHINQICDIFDWFIKNIDYSGGWHPRVPNHPWSVLRDTHSGDCKDHATALSAMLEAKGFRTVLIEWVDPSDGKGHVYVGVMISENQNEQIRKRKQQKVTRKILRRYDGFLKRLNSRLYPFVGRGRRRHPKVFFRDLTIDGLRQTFLLLDSTTRTKGTNPKSAPGLLDKRTIRVIEQNKSDWESIFKARPDIATGIEPHAMNATTPGNTQRRSFPDRNPFVETSSHYQAWLTKRKV
jgi:hypothetical protein